jgi:hypothetical protein
MRTILPAALTLGVTLAVIALTTPALAGDFYNDTCASQQGSDVWTLALSVTGDRVAQFWREDKQRIRRGVYDQSPDGDEIVARIEDRTLHLHIASGDAAWRAGDARGTFSCRFISYEKLARWQDAPITTARVEPPSAPQFATPHEPLELSPRPAAPTPDAMCDFEHHCYGADAGNNSVPITVDGDSATARIRIARLSFNALIDTGATSMSLPETAGDELISSGDATEGETTSVMHADGRSAECRTIIVKAVTIGGHVVRGVRTVIEPDGAMPLIGFKVLNGISGKTTINTVTSMLDF